MTIIKGLLKDKLGNQLYPETSFDQVKDDDGKTLKVWRGEIDGKVTDTFPVTPLLMKAKPVFTTLPGWKCDIRGCKDYDSLPQQAKDYVDFLEAHIGAPITMVSSGPKREEMTYRTPKI